MTDPNATPDPIEKAGDKAQEPSPDVGRSTAASDCVWNKPACFVLLGVGFGLLTGLTDSGLHAIKHVFALAPFSKLTPHYQWMPSVAYVCLFGLLGALLGLASCSLPRRWRPTLCLRAATLFFGVLYFFTTLNHLDSIVHVGVRVYGEAMLALGLAVVTFSWLIARPAKFHRLLLCSAPAMALLVAAWAGGTYGSRWWAERRMLAELPLESPDSPNVLLIVWDTVRAENLSLYGYRRPTTPTLEQLAALGTVFESAIATASWTLPSHAGMFTGRYLHEMPNLSEHPLPQHFTTLAESLHQKGYLTAGFVANPYYCSRYSGLDQGFTHYDDSRISAGKILDTAWLFHELQLRSKRYRKLVKAFDMPGRKRAEQVNEEFLCWMARPPDRPFFAFLNYFDAHNPYLPPPPFDETYGPHTDDDRMLMSGWIPDVFQDPPTKEQIRTAIAAYDGCIAYQDQQLGLLLRELKRRGELDNTLVIVTSDHGEQFGEHGIFSHWTSLHQPQVRVPLVMRLPESIPKGRRVRQAVSLRDLSATVMDLLHSSDSRFGGKSLARCWQSNPAGRPFAEVLRQCPSDGKASPPVLAEVDQSSWITLPAHYPNADGPVKAVWSGGKKYIRRQPHGEEELYDLEDDPLEMRNLAASAARSPMIYRFRYLLGQLVPGLAPTVSTPRVASPGRRADADSRR